jgi:hypothetical protein
MANLMYGSGNPKATFAFETILTQTPDCGYLAFTYDVQMTDLSDLSAYGIEVVTTTTSILTIQTTQPATTLPKVLALQWWAIPTQYYSDLD